MMASKSKIHPIIGIILAIYIMIFSLVRSYDFNTLYFLLAIYALFIIFGMYKQALMVIPFSAITILIFAGLTYLINKNIESTYAMANRLLGLSIAIIPGMSISSVDLTRSLNQLRVPRSITLGMMICLSFIPLLNLEVKHIKEAMKTRGVTSIINPFVFYRAFLIPLTMRIVNISDTLALSVEARGFAMKNKNYTVYKRVKIKPRDVIIPIAIIALSVVVVILWRQ